MDYKWIFIAFLFLVDNLTAREKITIPDTGWRVWPDTAAQWKFDPLFLPGDANLTNIPKNNPSVGWHSLDNHLGKAVTLPTTVEEHFWGDYGLRPYKDGYLYEKKDTLVKDGSYQGVSWWWTNVNIPKSFHSKRIFFQLPAARLRVEIYINQILAGYHLIGETFYECEITQYIKPGQSNHIAIRLTNPGGRFDWIDFKTMHWGKYEFQASHGFGGLDSGIGIIAKDSVYIEDTWVLNTPDLNTISANVLIRNSTNREKKVTLIYYIFDQNNVEVKKGLLGEYSLLNDTLHISKNIHFEGAKSWSFKNPDLFTLKVVLETGNGNDSYSRTFGFRWFQPENIGTDAIFLN